jgi:hypothetical protein
MTMGPARKSTETLASEAAAVMFFQTMAVKSMPSYCFPAYFQARTSVSQIGFSTPQVEPARKTHFGLKVGSKWIKLTVNAKHACGQKRVHLDGRQKNAAK